MDVSHSRDSGTHCYHGSTEDRQDGGEDHRLFHFPDHRCRCLFLLHRRTMVEFAHAFVRKASFHERLENLMEL